MAVDLDKAGKPKKWMVENSWGKDAGYQAIAAQIELLGKLTIVVMSLPVLQTLMSAITEFIGA